MKTFKKLIIAIVCLPILVAAKEKESEHTEHNEKKVEKGHEDHAVGEDHEKEGREESESNPQVGEGKGIIAASEKFGFKLSPQAEKNFEIKKIKISNSKSVQIPKSAIVTSGAEVNVYRFRDGYYKRIDFARVGQSGNTIMIQSSELNSSDELVISGTSFLRTAELTAFDGAPTGHSH